MRDVLIVNLDNEGIQVAGYMTPDDQKRLVEIKKGSTQVVAVLHSKKLTVRMTFANGSQVIIDQ